MYGLRAVWGMMYVGVHCQLCFQSVFFLSLYGGCPLLGGSVMRQSEFSSVYAS